MVRKNTIVIFLFFIFAFGINICQAKERDYKGDSVAEKIEFLREVLDLVSKQSAEEVSASRLIDGALFGMLASVDKYSQFLTPQMYKEMSIRTEGKFGGVGVEIRFFKDYLEILSVVKGSPAQKSGLVEGNRITAVETTPISSLSRADILNSLRGKPGTKVTFTVTDKENISESEVTVVRDVVVLESVVDAKIFDNIGYVRISSFVNDTDVDFKKVLSDFKKQDILGLVIDLRGNPGGVLEDALNVLNTLVKPNQILFGSKSKNTEQNFVFKSTDVGLLFDKELVVLIDSKSASGAEIIAGVIQAKKRGLVVGETSFGKGAMQKLFVLENDAAVKVTVSKYFLPGGKNIEGVGVLPDIALTGEQMIDKEDIALNTALSAIRGLIGDKAETSAEGSNV